jgi:hypothetical protein
MVRKNELEIMHNELHYLYALHYNNIVIEIREDGNVIHPYYIESCGGKLHGNRNFL